jgi:hypothetical protein
MNIETLESREVLSSGGPTADAQYMLEVMNLVRTNPTQGAEWVQQNQDADLKTNIQAYGVNLDAVKADIAGSQSKEPLAWNDQLAAAAQGQSDDMARNGFQSHTGSDGRNLEARLDAVGYTNRIRSAENAFAYARSPKNAMQAFLVDWGVADAGHRKTILDSSQDDANAANEVGIGIATTTKGVGPMVVTQNFGRRAGSKAQVVGVVYDDRNNDGHYSIGEGLGNAQVQLRNTATGRTTDLTTWDAGGYQAPVEPGTYDVTAKAAGQNLGTRTVTIQNRNVKVDFNAKAAPTTPPAPAATIAVSRPAVTAAPKAMTVAAPTVPTARTIEAPKPAVVVETPKVETPKPVASTVAPSRPRADLTSAAIASGLANDDWAVSTPSIRWKSTWDAR